MDTKMKFVVILACAALVVLSSCNSKDAVEKLDTVYHFSGAQVGAAKNIARVFWSQTPEKCLETVSQDRIIQIHKGRDRMVEIIRYKESNSNCY